MPDPDLELGKTRFIDGEQSPLVGNRLQYVHYFNKGNSHGHRCFKEEILLYHKPYLRIRTLTPSYGSPFFSMYINLSALFISSCMSLLWTTLAAPMLMVSS